MLVARVAVSVALALSVAGTSPRATAAPLGRESSPLVYGEDDRQEVFEHPDQRLAALAPRIVALVPKSAVHETPDGEVTLDALPWQNADGLCAGERFGSQPSIAYCGGLVVAPGLVLTAGHCLDLVSCAETALVSGFQYAGTDMLEPLGRDSVFGCAEVVVREVSLTSAAVRFDYAWVSLDRQAAVHGAIAIREDPAPVAVGGGVATISFGGGIPAKVDSGGIVYDARPDTLDYFVSTIDSFHGSSGSPVLDLGTLAVVGILARGGDDYVATPEGCRVTARISEGPEAAAEAATYAFRAMDALCPDYPDACAEARGEKRASTHEESGCSFASGRKRKPLGDPDVAFAAIFYAFSLLGARRIMIRRVTLRAMNGNPPPSRTSARNQ